MPTCLRRPFEPTCPLQGAPTPAFCSKNSAPPAMTSLYDRRVAGCDQIKQPRPSRRAGRPTRAAGWPQATQCSAESRSPRHRPAGRYTQRNGTFPVPSRIRPGPPLGARRSAGQECLRPTTASSRCNACRARMAPADAPEHRSEELPRMPGGHVPSPTCLGTGMHDCTQRHPTPLPR